MGRMRQISIERVDAVDEPATGHRWVIAKRSKQAEAKPEASELVKAAFDALRKDTELDISEDAAEALSALAEAHGLEFKLEKDEDAEESAEAEAEESAESDESDDAEGDEGDEGEGDDAEGDDAESDESDDAEGDEGDDEEQGTEKSVDERLATMEKALELLIDKLDPQVEPKVQQTTKAAPARRRRTSKQATGQDNLGEATPVEKSGDRPSFTNVIYG